MLYEMLVKPQIKWHNFPDDSEERKLMYDEAVRQGFEYVILVGSEHFTSKDGRHFVESCDKV